MLAAVQQQLAKLQRAEQIRQLAAEAEEALNAQRFPEAMNSLDQAVRLDPENEELKAKLANVRDRKQKFDEISTLMTQADSLGQRGDWTGAASVVEKALKIDQTDTKIRALYLEYSRQAKIAAQHGQIRDLLGKARTELSSRRYTEAIEILREVGKIDPSQAEMESMLQAAVSGQEQERRRKLLEQIHAEIENCLNTEDFDRATDLVERAVQQLPSESSLLQLKSRVGVAAKNFRTRQLIATAVARAQELFLESPAEALIVVQKALTELPGEERLLALEDSLRQRLKAAQLEEVRGRYLRQAQDAMGQSQFDRAVEILESYHLEFNDAAGVSELLDIARSELAQQQRRNRIANVVTKARSLMAEEQMDEAIRLLEPAAAETGDQSLARLLEEARGLRAEVERKASAVMARIAKLRETGRLDEAIEALQGVPAAAVPGSPANKLLNEIRGEQARKQATSKALVSATDWIEKGDFQKAIEALEAVQRAYGESPETKRAIAEIETRRKQIANESIAAALEKARALMVGNDAAGAITELKGVAAQVEHADSTLQGDWKRLGAEAAKPVARRTGNVAQIDFGTGVAEEARKKPPIALIAGGAAVVVLGAVGFFVFKGKQEPPPTPQTIQVVQQPVATTGTLLVKGSIEEIAVNVDGPTNTKGFTLPGGSATISLDPGTHTITFTKPGYTECPPQTVTIKAGGTATVPCQMTKIPGVVVPPATDAFLTIHSTPNAAVTIDGAAQGTVDSHGTLIVHIQQVKPGDHNLGLALSGYQSAGQSFSIKAGERKDFTIAMSQIQAAPKPTPAAAPPVTALFSASSSSVEQGQSVTLNWQTANAGEVSIDNGVGTVGASGSKDVNPSSNTTYVLTAKGEGGTQQRQVSVVVTAKVEKPAPAPAPVAAPVSVDEGAAIRATLASFGAAYNAHDMGRVQSIWSGIKPAQAKGVQSFFHDNPSSKVTDDCPASALSITGDSASWSCNETTVLNGGGKPQSHPIHFIFAKKGGAWTITDRR